MTKKIYLLIIILTIAALSGGIYYFENKPAGQVACTLEAKLCPDGSSVGRVGQNCEFALCPLSSASAIPPENGKTALKPKEADMPAAGACDFETGSVVSITINIDIPFPRCVKVGVDQFLKIINGTDKEITAGFGNLPDSASQLRDVKIPVKGEFVSTIAFGNYLAFGVHRLETSEYAGSGPEIWLMNLAEPVAAKSIIKGKVTVGPICPVERLDSPCLVPPEAYTSREIVLYAANGTTVLQRMRFAPDGTYQFEIPAGVYVLNIPGQGIGGSRDLPKTLTVKPGEAIEFNFSIDTGIR